MRTLSLALLAFVWFFTTGCTGELWYVDSRFTHEEEHKIVAAVDAWVALGAPVQDFVWRQHTDVRDTGRRVIVKAGIRAAAAVHPAFFEPDNKDAAVMQRDDLNLVYRIIMTDRLWESEFQTAISHEFGHHFIGPGHLADPGAVMFLASTVPFPTELDRQALVRGSMR